ncbi:DUF1707 domain-containing protein [Spirillospora sp. NPDC048911]|uniref:DUF1707 SHOCT-like domain-containing protein n=1 Tax=Spirillospora sp. NPDC048911 TaxID=3364527 RepID=UPI0037225222
MTNPEMRASDADRDRVATSLREHCAEGRITMDELHERLEATYAARTVGALQRVTADLPEEDLYALPVPASQRSTRVPAKRSSGDLSMTGPAAMWAGWASVSAICFTVWLIVAVTSGAVYPWFLWVAGPWGAILLMRTIFGPHRND